MTDIHAFDADGTASPGAQTALDDAVTGLATTADVTAQISAATDGLASEGFVTDTVATIPEAELSTPGLITLSTVSARAADTVQAAMSSVVTTDELFHAVTLASSPVTTTLLAAPFPLRVTSIRMVFDNMAVPASSTAYLTVTFRRFRAGGTTIVSKSSASSAITQHTPWGFDALSWNDSAAQLEAGDALNMGFSTTGMGTDAVKFPVCITVGYTPL